MVLTVEKNLFILFSFSLFLNSEMAEFHIMIIISIIIVVAGADTWGPKHSFKQKLLILPDQRSVDRFCKPSPGSPAPPVG